MRWIVTTMVILSFIASIGCGAKKVTEKELTVGLVQKEIRTGMSQADVAESLGSPNIVTKDSEGKETWIYDKFASEASYSHRGSFWTLILFGGTSESGSSRTSQRTLTVIIKFDDNGKVSKLSYHASKF